MFKEKLAASGFNPREELLKNNKVDFVTVTNAAGRRPDGVYLRTRSSNMGACDALVLEPIEGVDADLYLMTLNANQSVDCHEMVYMMSRIDAYFSALNIEGGCRKIRFFFVMPARRATEMQFPTLLHIKENRITVQQLGRIEVYALGLE